MFKIISKTLTGFLFISALALSGCVMTAKIKKNFSGKDFSGKDLRELDFFGLTLKKADFRGSDLRGADFRMADLREANFEGARLQFANFKTDTSKSGRAKVEGANFKGATMDEDDKEYARRQGAIVD